MAIYVRMVISIVKNLMNISFLKLSATLLTWLSAVVCIRFAGMILVILIYRRCYFGIIVENWE